MPSGNYVKFISAYLGERGESLPETEGELVTTSGEVIGRHRGVHNYTIGQRKGLGIAAGKPLYVVELDRAANRVVVGDDSDLRTNVCEIRDVNWISFAALEAPVRATVKIRHRHEPAAATVEPIDATSARVTFENKAHGYSVAAFATNLTNRYYLQSFLDLRAFGEGQMSGQPAEPREWGVTFRKNF